MSKWSSPEMNVVRFNEKDVIVASGVAKTITLQNFGNGVAGDGLLHFGNYTHTSNDVQMWNRTNLKDNMKEYFGYDFDANKYGNYFDGRGFGAIASDVVDNRDTSPANLNGTWEWDSSTSTFTKRQ